MRTRRWNELFALFFDPAVPAAFFFGSLATAVAGSALYALLSDLIGTTRPAQLGLLAGSLMAVMLVVLVLRQVVRVWVRRQVGGTLVVPPNEQAQPHGGLVLPVGLSPHGPERAILTWHLRGQRLRHCWMLVSPEVRTSGKFSDLRQWLNEQNVMVHDVDIADAKSPRHSYEATMIALQEAQALRGAWPAIVDITGGTATMSVGITLAAREKNVQIQYYPAAFTSAGDINRNSANAPLVVATVVPSSEAA